MDEWVESGSSNKNSQPSYCQRCGARVSSEMKFCPKCGATFDIPMRPPLTMIRERETRSSDVLGFVSVGVILILLALTYIQYPIEPSQVIEYFQGMAEQRVFIKPSQILFDSAIFFVYAAGVWGIILSALRIVFQRRVRRALGDLVGGFFSFFLVYLLTNYAVDVLPGRTALAYFVVAIGFLVIVNVIIHFAVPERR